MLLCNGTDIGCVCVVDYTTDREKRADFPVVLHTREVD
jgi:hypothetical protein